MDTSRLLVLPDVLMPPIWYRHRQISGSLVAVTLYSMPL
jgi:hypothetical protein